MIWNDENYPQAMAHLGREVRAKAIQMANQLRQEYGFDDGHAVELAISRARMWARRYGAEAGEARGGAEPTTSPGSTLGGAGKGGGGRSPRSLPPPSTPPPLPPDYRLAA